MGITLPALTPVEESLFLTLCGRAIDSRRQHSILGDTTADEILRKTGYDCGKFGMDGSGFTVEAACNSISLRSKALDRVARQFVAGHPAAVVVDLGAGLDSAMIRIAPPSTVDWYDVDLPAVIAARRELLPPPANAHYIGASAADPEWLDEVPTDRPAVIIVHGLLPFLTLEETIAMLNRITTHFRGGEVAFNQYNRLSIWGLRHTANLRSFGPLARFPGFDDRHEPQRWDPRLKLVEEALLTRAPEVAEFTPLQRLLNRLAGLSTGCSRLLSDVILRYRFPASA